LRRLAANAAAIVTTTTPRIPPPQGKHSAQCRCVISYRAA
jgi:hypothetical protein